MRRLVGAAVLVVGFAAGAQDGGQDASTAAEGPAAVAPVPVAAPSPARVEPKPVEEAVPPTVEPARRAGPELSGYLKAGYFFVVPPSDEALVGGRNGFRLVNARLGLDWALVERLKVVLSVDGSIARRRESDPLGGSRVVELKDAYASIDAHRFAKVRVGQFKAPFNAETLLGDARLPFITRSVATDGLVPPEGYTRPGLTLDRQVGVEVSSERLGTERFGFSYAVALVNGNGANALNNDNGIVAPVGRVTLEYTDRVTVGLNAFQNSESEGERPNRLLLHRLGAGADLAVRSGPFQALAVVLWRRTTSSVAGLPPENALGVVAQGHYLHAESGVEGGLRYTFYEPSSAVPADALHEVSAVVGYRPSGLPLRLLVQYTLRLEEAGVSAANDSVDLLAQVTW